MNSIDKYKIKTDKGIHYQSKICSVAGSIGHKESFSDLDNRITELTQSFFNQWRFIIESYLKLEKLFNELNDCSDVANNDNITSEYDIYSINHEVEFRDYSYLLIISINTYLDLFACIVDLIVSQEIREEHELTDLYKFGRKKNNFPVEILKEFQKFKDDKSYPWISSIKDTRNKIIHRGYNLKPKFEFKKSKDLIIQVYQGTDFYINQKTINISDLLNSFMTEMPQIEEQISNILIEKIDVLEKELDYELSYTFDGMINYYNYKELKPSS